MKTFPFYFVFACAMFILTQMRAQTAGLELSYGSAAYDMGELKDFTETFVSDNPSFSITENLPSGNYFGASFVVGIDKLECGVDFRMYETESRMEATENSNPVHYTHELNGYAFGLFAKYPLYYSPRFQLKAGLTATVFATIANIESTSSTTSILNEEYHGVGLGATPFIEPVYYITKWAYVGVRGSYAHDFGCSLYVRDNNDIRYEDANGDPIRINWSGLRGAVFIGFRINNE